MHATSSFQHTHTLGYPRLLPRWRDDDQRPVRDDSLQRALERALAGDQDGPALGRRLDRLAPFLAVELGEEEQPGGLLGELLEVDPALAPRVEGLKLDHRRILAVLDRLRARLKREPGSHEDRARLRHELADLLAEHRRAEEQLLLDAYLQDVGGEG